MSEIALDQFSFSYHRVDHAIPRFPPLAILCKELHTIVVKYGSEHIALHIGKTDEGMLQCFLAYNGMTVHSEADQYSHFLFDFNFGGQYFMVLHYPAQYSQRGEEEFELSVVGKSLIFSESKGLHVHQPLQAVRGIIYPFPKRVN